MTTTESPLDFRQRLDASNWDHKLGVGDWVSDLRRICLDNLTRGRVDSRRPTLRDRLFPLNSGNTLMMRDVLYAEGVWAAGTFVVCFLVFAIARGSLTGAIGFMLITALAILPLLPIWTGLGYYYVRKRKRQDSFSSVRQDRTVHVRGVIHHAQRAVVMEEALLAEDRRAERDESGPLR